MERERQGLLFEREVMVGGVVVRVVVRVMEGEGTGYLGPGQS